jgi:hypothetical protein
LSDLRDLHGIGTRTPPSESLASQLPLALAKYSDKADEAGNAQPPAKAGGNSVGTACVSRWRNRDLLPPRG